MKYEIKSTANFLVHLIRLAKTDISEFKLKQFRNTLIEVFRRRYEEHWFPENPFKGSAYRCIRINNQMDPIIAQAGKICGISSKFLYDNLPTELTIWIDPYDVSYRIGENTNIYILYEFAVGVNEPWVASSFRKKTCNKIPSENKPELKPTSCDKIPSENKPELKPTSSSRLNVLMNPKEIISIERLATMVLN